MKKKVLFFTYLFLGTIYCIAQDIPNIMPPSPNAASLGKYGQVPVGLFTGTPQVDIPLYSFATGKIVVPISLNYSSNGIRVDEMASDVGLSWALIAGGAITRTIMDDADENQTAAVPNFSDYTAETLTYLQNATNGEDGYDTANDMYSFNFNGFSGKFYLNENKIPVLINPSPLKIERTPLGPYAFKITDPSGIIYWFGSSASTEKIMYRTKLSGHNTWTGEEPSSWYISKIENPNSGDTVTFNYSVSNYSYDAGLSQSVARSKSSSGSYSGQNLVINESRVLGVILNSITSDSGKVTFVYAARDVVSNTKKIESIEIEDIHQKSIKKFILGYDLVTSSLETEYRNPHITYEPQYGKRLFLTSITEINDGISKPAYQLAYYDYDKIPPRFSYAQDYWGYFNGEQSNAYLVSDDDYYYSGSKFSPSTLKNIFGNVGGNKKPNGLYSKNGLLKTITYPTGGFNELFYEPHSYFGKKQIYPSKKQVAINISNTADQFSQSQTVISEIIPFSQEKVPLYFSAGTVRCWESSWPSHHIKATLTVEVAENGSDVFTTPANGTGIYVVIPNGDKVYDISSSVVAAPTIVQHYIDLVEGNKYRFKVSVPFECIRGDFSTSFYDSAYTSIDANIEVGGQRLSKMITTDNENKKEIKEYYYGNLSCLSCSSGVIEPPVPSITLKTYHDWTGSTWSGDPSYALTATDILTLSSSTLYPLYTKQNSHIGYTSVVESIGENFSAGGIMHKFMNTPVEIAQPLRGLYVPGTAFNTTFGTGNEIETQYFSKNRNSYITTKKIVNSYELNPVLNKERFGYSINQRDLYSGGSWSIIDKIKGYDITRYIIRSQWHYIKESTEEIYDLNGLNPIKTKTNFSYHNPAHLQLTSQTTINSSHETLETKYYYAPDLEMASQPYITDLKTSNIIIPALKTQAFKGGAKISDQLIIYDKSQETSNLLLPKEVFVNKGIEEINLSLDKKITYNQYDDRGNILQYTIEGGTPVAIIWGYNKTQPIAKIENMSYASIPSGTITSLQSRSDADNDNCMSDSCTEQLLRNELNALRNSFSNAFVSTYTYNPLVGVTSITDPKGIVSYYEYDSFGRLKFVKDQELNVLQKYCYNYKGQQVDCSDNSSTSVFIYKSAARSGSFTKNNCTSGGVPSSVSFSLAAGSVTSTISQQDADAKATAKFNTEGQVYANTNGSCTFYSKALSGSFNKSNCPAGGFGASVPFSQIAGVSTSNTSQAEADALAMAIFNTNGKANANANGNCTFYNVAMNATFTKNNCDAGGFGSNVRFGLIAGITSSNISQADADAQALAILNANGQVNANTNGNCTFYSAARSGYFTKNNCTAGGSGSAVLYNQGAGVVSSNSSQADADALGMTKFNTDGQAYANANGICTFYSAAQSAAFAKNNCAVGGAGSTVVYNQGAGVVSSNSSQAEADALGFNKFNIEGQANANTYGICTFYSVARSDYFTKNNCAAGGYGSAVLYSQGAGTSVSNTSQADADAQALAIFNANGQANANAYGSCTFYSVARSDYFTKNNCAPGGYGSAVLYNQGAGTAVSNASQADADTQALAIFNANGQANANAYGSCTFYSVARSDYFTKNNCPAGGAGSSVLYNQGAGTAVSNTSQADADAQALVLFNANGQANANTNGYCTFYSIALSSEITKNNCASGGVGSGVIYTQGAGIETSTVSQEDANSKGYVRWYTEGQAYINANGYCSFNSAALGGYFAKTNCGTGGDSPSIYYGQAAGTIVSTISQADADAQAVQKFYADGQANANASQGCTYKNTAQSRLFTRNNCAPGATPASVWYTVAAGVHTSYISQADANTYAQLQIDTYGQAYANSTASCVFYNKLINPIYYKTDCPAGTTNPYVYYSVEAGKYQSTISQADADNKALTEANTYGPAYANEVGRCLNPGEVEE